MFSKKNNIEGYTYYFTIDDNYKENTNVSIKNIENPFNNAFIFIYIDVLPIKRGQYDDEHLFKLKNNMK